ncbi:MAG TPA: alpha/beta fold hydrolase [Lysobacter sp.]|nr:alpha/beta fold hydrolase [Lysobacter sp.]
MAVPSLKIRTIVRSAQWGALRTAFRLGSMVAPAATARRAALLFSTPGSATRTRARHTAVPEGVRESQLHTRDGIRLRTYVWGDPAREPYVLLAHGWSSHATRFAGWITPLRQAGYAVVAFDQPGHGLSEGRRATLPGFVAALLDVAAHFGPAAAVIGHSLGGTATALALTRGLVAQRVVLVAPAADPIDAAHRFARVVGMAEHVCRAMYRWFENRIGISFEELQVHRDAPRIGRPALVVHDLDDREVPWAEGERLVRHWPHAHLLTTEGLGHNRIVDAPPVLDAALRFLRGGTVGVRVVSTPNLPFGFA